jgi:hypothetical protein
MMDVARDFQRMQDYIVGRLSGDELRLFEDRLASDPELVREFEQSLRLKEGLEQLRQQKRLASAAPLRTVLRITLPLLLAAALAAVALLIRPELLPARPPVLLAALPAAAAAPVDVSPLYLLSYRGDSATATHALRKDLIEVYVERPVNAPRARLTLRPQTSTTMIGAAVTVDVAQEGPLHAYLDGARLSPGDYVLTVEPLGGASEPSRSFPFTLTPAPDSH